MNRVPGIESLLGLATVILTVPVFNRRRRVQSNMRTNPILAKLSNRVDNLTTAYSYQTIHLLFVAPTISKVGRKSSGVVLINVPKTLLELFPPLTSAYRDNLDVIASLIVPLF
jgi:hypothetical protein